MLIYRVENTKGIGPFRSRKKWNVQPRTRKDAGYSYRDMLIIRDNFYRFGILNREQFDFFNLNEVLTDNEFSLSCYYVPSKFVIIGTNDVAFDYHNEKVRFMPGERSW
jgi:hypothetical protein